VDPNTGVKTVSLDPNVPAVAEPLVEAAAGLAPLFGDAGILVGGILVGILGAWRKVKPDLETAKSDAEQSYAAAAAVVEAVEEFKASNPSEWSKLGAMIEARLAKQGMDPEVIKNVIRGIRGLPAKT